MMRLPILILLRHELGRGPAKVEISGKTVDPSISQIPRHCWAFAICDAVVLKTPPDLALARPSFRRLSGPSPLRDRRPEDCRRNRLRLLLRLARGGMVIAAVRRAT